jgi:MFS family permease
MLRIREVLSPVTGRVVGKRGPRPPLLAAGTTLALGGLASLWLASLWLAPTAPLPAVVAVYALFGLFLGAVNPPITATAISGMPRSMAGVASGLASAGRQTGTTLGAAIAGTIALVERNQKMVAALSRRFVNAALFVRTNSCSSMRQKRKIMLLGDMRLRSRQRPTVVSQSA